MPNAKGEDGIAGTEDDDFRLSINSPAKDVGVNSFLPAGVATDLDGGPRFDGPIIGAEIVDLGPYEWSDCNDNDSDDGGDIFLGTSLDCNNNGLPDECDITNGTSEDCTGNDIPDECEPDCQANGVADSCDIAGASADTIGPADGIPDECQEDCNQNLIPDELELAGNDCNFNGVPDDCDPGTDGVPDDCAGPPLPATMGCDSDADCIFDPPPDGAGATCSADGVCVCPSGLDDACSSAAVCISDFCYVPRHKYVSFRTNISPEAVGRTAFRVKLTASTNLPACVNEIRWVDAPTADDTALLRSRSAGPWYSADWPDVVHVGDSLIAPDSTYEIWAVQELNEDSSQVVEFPTQAAPGVKHFGDAVGFFNGVRWTPPNGAVSMDDVVAALKTFKDPNAFNATHVSITDISVTD
ncbi:MAG: hypothetical protein IH897_06045, partial [Planctomycetes bacterium]|nr:hypothetical protein [Planctomycetota bacterium]